LQQSAENSTSEYSTEAGRSQAHLRQMMHFDDLNGLMQMLVAFFFMLFKAFGGGSQDNPLLSTFSGILGFDTPEDLVEFSERGGTMRDIDYNNVDMQAVQAFNTTAVEQLPEEFQQRIANNNYVEDTLEGLTVEQLGAIDYDEFKRNFSEILEEGTLASGSVDGRNVDFHNISWLGHLPLDAEASLEEAMLIARYVEGDKHTNTQHDLRGARRRGQCRSR